MKPRSSARQAMLVWAVALGLGASVAFAASAFGANLVLAASAVFATGGVMVLAFPRLLGGVASLAGQLRWWHWAWAVLLASSLTYRVRDVTAIYAQPIDNAAVVRIAMVGAVGLVLLLTALTRGSALLEQLTSGVSGILALYALYSLASTVWSVYPAWTLYKSGEYLIDVLAAACLIGVIRNVKDLKVFVDWNWVLLGVLLTTVWAGLILAPGLATNRGVGVLGFQVEGVLPALSANRVGELGAIVAIVALARMVHLRGNRVGYVALLCVGGVTMLIAQSRSPLLGFAIAAVYILYSTRRLTWPLVIGFGGTAIAVSPVGTTIVEFLRRGQSLEMILSLSNRVTVYWVRAGGVFLDNAVYGVGGYAGGRFAIVPLIGNVGAERLASSVDNAFLEVAISLGVIGLFIIVLGVLLTAYRLRSARIMTKGNAILEAIRVEAIAVLIIQVVRAAFSSGPIIWHHPTPFLVAVVVGEVLRRMRAEGTDGALPAEARS